MNCWKRKIAARSTFNAKALASAQKRNQKRAKQIIRSDGKFYESISDAARDFDNATFDVARCGIKRSLAIGYQFHGFTWGYVPIKFKYKD